MPEHWTLPLLAVGGVLLAVGLLWLLIVAVRTGFFRKAIFPVFLIVLGVAAAGFIPVYNRLYPPPVQKTGQLERKQTEAGFEERITLTGAERAEYAKLKSGTKFGVIQWANPDVTDEDAAVLADQTELREIDLADAQVTDKTLELLVKLPKLEEVRVSRTQITPDGIKRLILDDPNTKVKRMTLLKLKVPTEPLRKWRESDLSKDRYFQN